MSRPHAHPSLSVPVPHRWGRAGGWPIASACLAAFLAWLVATVGPPAVDAPAHLFGTLTFARNGFALWNNFWYSGHYEFVLYSLIYYPVALVLGTTLVAVASVAIAAAMMTRTATHQWGAAARWPSLSFAVTAPIVGMVSGMYPFLAGLAAASVALYLLQVRRRVLAALAIVIASAFSPLAFLLLAVILAAIVLASGDRRGLLRQNLMPLAAVVAAVLVAGLLSVLFAQPAYYPYQPLDLATALGLSLLGFALTRGRVRGDLLGALFIVYLVVNVTLYVVPSPIGANVTRLYSVAAVALVWLAMRVRRPRLGLGWVGLVVGLTLVVQLAPFAAAAYRSFQDQASAQPAFWRPVLRFVHSHPASTRRVEVVATADHWEAYYLAKAGVSLARGWYRQSDFPQNAVLYRPRISPSSYQAWLRRLGIEYVFLPHVTLDYSSQAEARLLLSGHSGLRLVSDSGNWRIYRLPDAVGLVTGSTAAPTDVHLGANNVSFRAPLTGRYTIRVRYSPYWHVGPGVCLSATPDGMMDAEVQKPGTVALTMPDPIDAVMNAASSATPACSKTAG